MSWSSRLLVFLVLSLIAMLAYGAFSMFVMRHAEEVISQAPKLPEGLAAQQSNAACELATRRRDDLLNTLPENDNYALRDRQLAAADAQVDRACRNN